MDKVKKLPISRQKKPSASLMFLFLAAASAAVWAAVAAFFEGEVGVAFFVFVAAICKLYSGKFIII